MTASGGRPARVSPSPPSGCCSTRAPDGRSRSARSTATSRSPAAPIRCHPVASPPRADPPPPPTGTAQLRRNRRGGPGPGLRVTWEFGLRIDDAGRCGQPPRAAAASATGGTALGPAADRERGRRLRPRARARSRSKRVLGDSSTEPVRDGRAVDLPEQDGDPRHHGQLRLRRRQHGAAAGAGQIPRDDVSHGGPVRRTRPGAAADRRLRARQSDRRPADVRRS